MSETQPPAVAWTRTPPKRPGWYWWQENDRPPQVVVVTELVDPRYGSVFTAHPAIGYGESFDCDDPSDEDAWWPIPIEPPGT